MLHGDPYLISQERVMDQNYGYAMQPQDTPPAAYIPREMFSVGEVLGTGLKIWLKNFVPFTLITLICYIPFAVWFYTSAFEGHSASRLTFIIAAIVTITNSVATGAITYGTVMSLRNTPASIGACISKGFSRALPSIFVGILVAICVFAGMIALVIPGLIVGCVLYVAVPVSVIEAPGVGGALSRSSALTSGHRWGIFALMVIAFIISAGVDWINTNKVMPWIIAGTTSISTIRIKVVATVLAQYIFLATIAGVMASVSYYLLRSEKEGTNIDQIGSVFD
jgi:hypothetical protein